MSKYCTDGQALLQEYQARRFKEFERATAPIVEETGGAIEWHSRGMRVTSAHIRLAWMVHQAGCAACQQFTADPLQDTLARAAEALA